jgi:hypothetical protein
MMTSPGSNENDYQYQLEQSQASPAGELPVIYSMEKIIPPGEL